MLIGWARERLHPSLERKRKRWPTSWEEVRQPNSMGGKDTPPELMQNPLLNEEARNQILKRAEDLSRRFSKTRAVLSTDLLHITGHQRHKQNLQRDTFSHLLARATGGEEKGGTLDSAGKNGI